MVHAYELLTPVAIVPDAPPNEYFSVFVKPCAPIGVLIVTALPIAVELEDRVGAACAKTVKVTVSVSVRPRESVTVVEIVIVPL